MNMEMAITDILQQDLTIDDFSSVLKSAILKGLFECRFSESNSGQNRNLWGDYFDYYHEQCIMALSSRGGLAQVVKCHGDIVRIAQLLRNPENTRESIRDKEKARQATLNVDINDDLIFSAIDLVVRVSLMIFVGDQRDFQDVFTGSRNLTWPGGRLDTLLATDFNDSGSLATEHVKLEKLFNARSLERIGGISIDWTNNLADHLRVKDDRNDKIKVAIFHYASFLKTQKKSQLWPPGLIEETIQTLALLFPEFDEASNKWFEKKSKKQKLDRNTNKCGHLAAEDRQIENFHYWRDRIVVLKQVFDEAEPRGLKRWWRDQRRPVQWYNFWLAVALIVGLTLFFGIVQSIEGGIQVWKAYHPS